MSKVDIYVEYAVSVANDNTKGYSQSRRRIAQTQEEVDEIKDGDCSTVALNGLVLSGIDIGDATYTGNMLSPLLKAGFKDVTSSVNLRTGKGLRKGDIVLRPKTNTRNGHVAIMIDSERLVQAQYDYDGKVGDSSGREIRIQNYYDSPFTYVLRLEKDVIEPTVNPYSEPTTSKPNGKRFSGNDAGWFEFELHRIGYSWSVLGCKDNKPDEVFGAKCWEILLYEMKQANDNSKSAGAKIRTYLKGVPSK